LPLRIFAPQRLCVKHLRANKISRKVAKKMSE
jgi:hypothetical protein